MKTTTKIIDRIIRNPDAILILLGLAMVLTAFLLPLRIGHQTIFGGLGLLTLIIGIIVHKILVGT
ncbi:MAG: hypothetical protein NWE95_02160 [Candidatus Bathyarchaeota archaeon]|nr:hypothetical protein [Candidatus Bathyarchaeota archaeon]